MHNRSILTFIFDYQTGSRYPMVGNTSVTERPCLIVQLTDTSFWSRPDNTVYAGCFTTSSSSEASAAPTTRTRKLKTAWKKLLLYKSLCPLQRTQKVNGTSVYSSAWGQKRLRELKFHLGLKLWDCVWLRPQEYSFAWLNSKDLITWPVERKNRVMCSSCHKIKQILSGHYLTDFW